MGYRIKTVAELTGIPRNTLLAWERRYGLLSPDRQDNGYREFTDQDVAVLREIKRLVDAGHKVSEAISLLGERGRGAPVAAPAAATSGEPPGLSELRDQLTTELLAFQRSRADRLLPRLQTLGYGRLIREVYFPVLREVGLRWERGEATVAQEHFASEFIREQLVAMLLALESGPVGGPSAIVAGYPGERHEGGLLGASVLLALQGWRITYLGADVPLPDLLLLLHEAPPRLVCVGVMQAPPTGELSAFARALRAGSGEGTRVVIGGAGVSEARLPSIPGVEWVADVEALLKPADAN